MSAIAPEIRSISVEEELKHSYLDYAMSVIVGRALPDVRDGLKPVHRRVLYAMHELGTEWNKPYKKSARVVGDVIGKYHPHGESAVYDTMVRMAQPFSLRYLLVDGQGNFGSVDGDAPAAMRYTEVRMSKLTSMLLSDLEKDTVDFVPNYDGSERAPVVLPTRFPNLLVNGATGIAVGMATNIPPHNLTEVIKATLALLDDPTLSVADLMQYVPGPDFPTYGIIQGSAGIRQAYETGRGRVVVRARSMIETQENGRENIVVTEIPYQVNKARLIERIAELVKEKLIEGISGLRDESDKDGMRIVIELKRGEVAEVLLNKLYNQTQMQTMFGINMVALVDNQPRTLSLKQFLEQFILHRRVVVNRRTQYELRKAKERAHILEGLSVALVNLDRMIELIKTAASPAEAKTRLLEALWDAGWVAGLLARAENATKLDSLLPEEGLQGNQYRLTLDQAQAILDLRLHRLTGLEQDKIRNEYDALLKEIAELQLILSSPARLKEVIREELVQIQNDFGDARRTEIAHFSSDLCDEDLIENITVAVTLSQAGYIKTTPVETYQSQRRGGRGKVAATMKQEDFVVRLLTANMHDTLLCFSSLGKVYWLKVHTLPQGSRTSQGKPIVNLLPLAERETITAILPIESFDVEDHYIFMATRCGVVKKVPLQEFSRPRPSGIIAIKLDEDDALVAAQMTDGHKTLMLFSDAGKVVHFEESCVRPMGRSTHGVIGMRMDESSSIISLVVVEPQAAILTATARGFGKRTLVSEYPLRGRGAQGVISIQTTERNGQVVGAVEVSAGDQAMLITNTGRAIRIRTDEVSLVGRNTQGVTLIGLDPEEILVSIESVAAGSLDAEETETETDTSAPESPASE